MEYRRGFGRPGGWQQANLPAADDENQSSAPAAALGRISRFREETRAIRGSRESRSEALAWCVTLVGEHTDAWLTNLRDAMTEVNKLRSTGPDLNPDR